MTSHTEKNTRVLLLGASLSTRNMGVGALASGAVRCIKKRYPASDIFLLDYGKEEATYNLSLDHRNVLVQLVNLRFSKNVFLRNHVLMLVFLALVLRMIPSKGFRDAVLRRNPHLKRVFEADMAFSVAGGDSFSDIYGLERLLYVSLPMLLVIAAGKRLVLLPQTLGPFKGGLARTLARFVMDRAEAVYSRDYSSMVEARELLGLRGPSDKVRFGYDLGFLLEPSKPAELKLDGWPGDAAEGVAVGFNVSGLLYIGGYTRQNMFGLKHDYKALVTEIIDFIIMKKGASVILIPHVFGGRKNAESDSNACEALYRELCGKYREKLFLLRGEYDPHEIKYVIGKTDMFIGSRMHACIAALSQCVPSVPLSYSRKFMGVMESIGVEDCVADPCRMGRDAIINIIDRTFEERSLIRERLKKEMSGVRESALALLSRVR